MGKKKQFAFNVASGWVQQGSRILVGFFMLPYAMRRLGEEEYGIYQLAFSAIVLFNFLQVGMGPALIRFCARAIAEKDEQRVQKVSSSAQFILGGIGLAGMLGIFLLSPLFVRFYSISENLIPDTFGLLGCMALSFFLNFYGLAQQNLLFGAGRYDQPNGVYVVQNLVRVVVAIMLFEFVRPSVFFYGIAILLSHIVRVLLLRIFLLQNIGRSALFSFRSVDSAVIRKMFGFSLMIIIQSMAGAWVFQGPSLIIGKLLGVQYVAFFAPALLVATSMRTFIGQSLNPIVTLAAEESATRGGDRLGRWTVQIAQLVAAAGFGFLTMFFLFGETFVGLWLGAERAWLWTVVMAVSVGGVLLPIQGVTGRMAIGAGNIKLLTVGQVILAVEILLGSVIGIRFGNWSLLGVALFMGISIFVFSICLACAYASQFKYKIADYLIKVYLRTAGVAGIVAGLGYMALKKIPHDSWTGTLLCGVMVGMVYLLFSWLWLFPPQIKQTARKLFGRIVSK